MRIELVFIRLQFTNLVSIYLASDRINARQSHDIHNELLREAGHSVGRHSLDVDEVRNGTVANNLVVPHAFPSAFAVGVSKDRGAVLLVVALFVVEDVASLVVVAGFTLNGPND